MQKKIFYLILLLGIVIVLFGCEDSKHPTSFTFSNEHQMQELSSRPSDDTANSDILSPQYPEDMAVIVAIGDSITYGVGSTMGGYPVMLENKFREAGYNVVVHNEGVPGEKSPETLDRFLETIVGADIVLLMIGTNDLRVLGICPGRVPCNTVSNIEAMLNFALISNTAPVVSTITPTHSHGSYAWMDYSIRSTNTQIYNVATNLAVPVADNYEAIMTNGGDTLFSDGHHFNDWGCDVIAQEFYDIIIANNLIKTPQK